MTNERPHNLEGKPKDKLEVENTLNGLFIYECYKNSPYSSIKHSSYFFAYTDLFSPYREREITFVEIGALNGGSLFMWRAFFGPKARIIGVDLNPAAKRWEQHGFEIHIGNQSDPAFWQEFFKSIGPVDIVLDDGGHTYEQQIITTHACIPHIRDGGLMVIEDTHTSYFKDFGYPTRYSFIEWTKNIVDNINSRLSGLDIRSSRLPYRDTVFAISFHESIVSMKINRALCFDSYPISNGGKSDNNEDYRHKGNIVYGTEKLSNDLARKLAFLKEIPIVGTLVTGTKRMIVGLVNKYYSRAKSRNTKHLF